MLADAPVSPSIPVADFGRAKAFYRDTLGLTPGFDDGSNASFSSGGGTTLYLYATSSAGQAAHTLAGWQVADLDKEMAELRSRGVVFEDYDMPGLKTVDGVAEMGGIRGSWFKDSEGNILGLVQM